jgi:hypothetical protein
MKMLNAINESRPNAVLLCVLALIAAWAAPARATLVVADFNDLAPGGLNGQGGGVGLSGSWGNTGTIDVSIANGDLSAPVGTNYSATQSGTGKSVIGDWGDPRQSTRALSTALTGDTVWFSFLVQNTTADSRGGISFNRDDFDPRDPRVQSAAGQLFANNNRLGNMFTVGETALVVGRILVDDAGADAWDIWVNPNMGSGIGGLGATALSFSDNTISAAGIHRLGVVSYHTGTNGDQNGAIVDAIRVSDGPNAFAEVGGVIVPEPATVSLAAMSLLLLTRRRRRCA